MRKKPARLAHVVYRTRRFEEMLAWYQDVFDATVQYQNPALAFLTYDDEHHRFALANLNTIRPDEGGKDSRGLIGVDHVAFSYESLGALLETYTELKGKAVLPYWCVHHGMSASLYYADPDGNQMEFTADAFPTTDECHAYFHSGAMDQNGVGVEFDPEDWLSRLAAGEKDLQILAQLPQGEPSPIRGAMMTLGA